MGILQRTERSMVRAMCGLLQKDRKSAKGLIGDFRLMNEDLCQVMKCLNDMESSMSLTFHCVKTCETLST